MFGKVSKGTVVQIAHKYDYAGRLAEQQKPDGTKTLTIYNANGTAERQIAENGSCTYFKYDGLNRLTEQWTPFEISKGNTLYTYSKIDYDKAGRKLAEKAGKDKVILWELPQKLTVKNYSYYKNGKVKNITDAEGRKTEYLYDDDGNIIKESIYTDSTNKLVTEYAYNYLQKVAEKKQHINKGDLYGRDFENTEDTILKTTFKYDKNGNATTITTPENISTSYT